MTDAIELKVRMGYVEVDPYPIPPLIYITEGPIPWILAQAVNKRHGKHLAASIILGQPFNQPYKGADTDG